jgi:hypothetical protein
VWEEIDSRCRRSPSPTSSTAPAQSALPKDGRPNAPWLFAWRSRRRVMARSRAECLRCCSGRRVPGRVRGRASGRDLEQPTGYAVAAAGAWPAARGAGARARLGPAPGRGGERRRGRGRGSRRSGRTGWSRAAPSRRAGPGGVPLEPPEEGLEGHVSRRCPIGERRQLRAQGKGRAWVKPEVAVSSLAWWLTLASREGATRAEVGQLRPFLVVVGQLGRLLVVSGRPPHFDVGRRPLAVADRSAVWRIRDVETPLQHRSGRRR